jgi:ElaB/YqjD/DUF883 family membrane-anchored ribosome-binding protein
MSSWRDRVEKAKQIARERAPEMQARAEELAKQAGKAAGQQSRRGRAKIDQQLDRRREAAEQREQWYETASGMTHTEGFPDEESMRRSIEAAAAHGWVVANITEVKKRRLPGGFTTLVAREAVERVKQSARFMVTFRREALASTEDSQLDAE